MAAALAGSGTARAEPPITSPQDAACRNEARGRVFSMPDPENVGLRELGRRVWTACMARAAEQALNPTRKANRHFRKKKKVRRYR